MDATGRVFRKAAQFRVKGDIRPAAWLAVEERPRRNRNAEHFLKTYSLCAELDFVSTMRFRLAPLVFNWEWTPESRKARKRGRDLCSRGVSFRVGEMEFHHVRDAGDAEPPRDKAHCRRLTKRPPRLALPLVNAPVQHPAVRREPVFRPCAFDMDKRALPLAKKPVLQCGKHNEVFIGGVWIGSHYLGRLSLCFARASECLMKQRVEKTAGGDVADPYFRGVAQDIFVAPGGDFLV